MSVASLHNSRSDCSLDAVSLISSDDGSMDDDLHNEIRRRARRNKSRRRGSNGVTFFFTRRSSIKAALDDLPQEGNTSKHGSAEGNLRSSISSVESVPHVIPAGNTSSNTNAHVKATSKSPQEFFDVMLRTRRYSTLRHSSLETAYCNVATPLQEASYDPFLMNLATTVAKKDVEILRPYFEAGLSPNPCREVTDDIDNDITDEDDIPSGGTLVHAVCRKGAHRVLKMLVNDFDVSVQVADHRGRTPLHYTCASELGPFFEVIDLLLRHDRRALHISDVNGHTPLDLVPQDQWGAWIDFLYAQRDAYWPRRHVRIDGEEGPPPLVLEPANSRPCPNPRKSLPLDLARLVARGELRPEAARAKADGTEMVESPASQPVVLSDDRAPGIPETIQI